MAKQKSYSVKIKSKSNNKLTVKVDGTPRNTVVVALIQRGGCGAGLHGKSTKAQRKNDKQNIKNLIHLEF